jgi:hypothetical protein
MQELLAMGNEDGAATCADILFATGEMQRGLQPGKARN